MYHPRIVHLCNVKEVAPSKRLNSKALIYIFYLFLSWFHNKGSRSQQPTGDAGSCGVALAMAYPISITSTPIEPIGNSGSCGGASFVASSSSAINSSSSSLAGIIATSYSSDSSVNCGQATKVWDRACTNNSLTNP